MIVCLCFVDALLYGRSISTDQNLAYWSFQNQNEWPRALSLHSRFLTIILDVISLRDAAFLAASREEFKRARRKK
jgi:hypothetical protein